jgi:DNA polymerase-3 subunit beta
MTLTGTDLNVGLITKIEPRVEQPGAIALPAKRLLDYCNLLPDGDIKFKLGENNWMSITAGRSRTRIPGMGVDSFPELPAAPDSTLDLPTDTLVGLVNRTKLAITVEESRFTLSGALFHHADGKLTMVATDGHRLAYCTAAVPGGGTKFILPLTAIRALPAAVGGAERVGIACDDNHIFLQTKDATMVARLMNGHFPDYERVLPRMNNNVATINRKDLAGAIERVAQFADERSHAIRLALTSGEVSIAASAIESGESTDAVPCSYDGPNIEIGFNASYITDFLNVAGADMVTLHLHNEKSAGEFRVAGSDDYRYVVMPMRI